MNACYVNEFLVFSHYCIIYLYLYYQTNPLPHTNWLEIRSPKKIWNRVLNFILPNNAETMIQPTLINNFQAKLLYTILSGI